LLFGPVPELVPGILAENAHKVWIALRPVVGRAIWWFGYLSKTPTVKAGGTRSRYHYSIRRFISMFLRRRKRDSCELSQGRSTVMLRTADAIAMKLGRGMWRLARRLGINGGVRLGWL